MYRFLDHPFVSGNVYKFRVNSEGKASEWLHHLKVATERDKDKVSPCKMPTFWFLKPNFLGASELDVVRLADFYAATLVLSSFRNVVLSFYDVGLDSGVLLCRRPAVYEWCYGRVYSAIF